MLPSVKFKLTNDVIFIIFQKENFFLSRIKSTVKLKIFSEETSPEKHISFKDRNTSFVVVKCIFSPPNIKPRVAFDRGAKRHKKANYAIEERFATLVLDGGWHVFDVINKDLLNFCSLRKLY